MELAGRVVGESLDAGAHQRLIDEYIDQVAQQREREATDVVDKDALVRRLRRGPVPRSRRPRASSMRSRTQLFAFAGLLETDARVRDALLDPSLPAENKRGLVADALGDRANPFAVNMLGFVVEQGRSRELGRIVEGLAEVAAETPEHAVAEVRSAVPLDEARHEEAWPTRSPAATGRRSRSGSWWTRAWWAASWPRSGDEVFDGSVALAPRGGREHLAATTTRSG